MGSGGGQLGSGGGQLGSGGGQLGSGGGQEEGAQNGEGTQVGGPDPALTEYEFHTGVDVANQTGTEVRATAEGIVRHAGWEGGYGRLVIIDHGRGFRTFYGHLSKAMFVKVGDRVTRGQLIARMGSSGTSTGPHLHYEVWHNGKRVNPLRYMRYLTLEGSTVRQESNPQAGS
ncbi:MAG: M23 family metallopeptidase [Elusimicrobia bacterium]|nr:M23 family metallopeptidase [Elusimicrobiota bacterium]